MIPDVTVYCIKKKHFLCLNFTFKLVKGNYLKAVDQSRRTDRNLLLRNRPGDVWLSSFQVKSANKEQARRCLIETRLKFWVSSITWTIFLKDVQFI
jgi:hypothetical protein